MKITNLEHLSPVSFSLASSDPLTHHLHRKTGVNVRELVRLKFTVPSEFHQELISAEIHGEFTISPKIFKWFQMGLPATRTVTSKIFYQICLSHKKFDFYSPLQIKHTCMHAHTHTHTHTVTLLSLAWISFLEYKHTFLFSFLYCFLSSCTNFVIPLCLAFGLNRIPQSLVLQILIK